MKNPHVSIVMGSDSDLPVMKQAADVLAFFGIPFEMDIVSAHRTPDKMVDFAKGAHKRGIKVIIAGAGGAAHLPGMIASLTPLPVIGVPVKSESNQTEGWDSVLSILQMPGGVPVATVAVNGAKNAGILAAQIIGTSDDKVMKRVLKYKTDMKAEVEKKSASVKLKDPRKEEAKAERRRRLRLRKLAKGNKQLAISKGQ